jgi:hypothetical protein
MLALNCRWRDGRFYPAANLSNFTCQKQKQEIKKGRRVMVSPDIGTLPRENPCAQCGHPIAAPDWIEAGPRRASYLWYCRACDYRFEAIAVFSDQESGREALAA